MNGRARQLKITLRKIESDRLTISVLLNVLKRCSNALGTQRTKCVQLNNVQSNTINYKQSNSVKLNTAFLILCCKYYFPVKLNYVSTVNVDEKQCTDFLVAIKLNYYVYLSLEIILKSDGF